MTEVARALNSFWNRFLTAYVEGSVPDDAQFPYLTYEVAEPSWDSQVPIRARLWYEGSSFVPINSKVSEIKEAIGGGVSIKTDTGFIVLFADSNFAQNQPYDDEGQSNIKVVYLSLILQAYTRR